MRVYEALLQLVKESEEPDSEEELIRQAWVLEINKYAYTLQIHESLLSIYQP